MPSSLNPDQVRQWIEGQREGQQVADRERRAFLRALSPEDSLRIYLGLCSSSRSNFDPGPSPVLLSMRKLLELRQEHQRD